MSDEIHPDHSKKYSDDPDVILMTKFQDGDKAAFEDLMRKYYPRVLNFVYRYVNNRTIAEDMAQDVFIKVYNNASSYKPQAKFSTWLFTIAKNHTLNELRRLKRTPVSLDQTFSDEEGGQMTRQVEDENALTAGEGMLESEKSKAVREAIQALPENQRIAVLLRRYEKLSYEDIAKTMNTSVKAVKSLLSRAKENLRDRLSKYIED